MEGLKKNGAQWAWLIFVAVIVLAFAWYLFWFFNGGYEKEVMESPPDGLIFHVPFDETQGATSFRDLNGNVVASCSGSNCPASGLPGRVNKAARFNGGNYVSAIKTELNSDMAQLSLFAWVKREREGAWERILGKYYYESAGREFGSWVIMIGDKNESRCAMKINGVWKSANAKANTLKNDGQWHLVGCVYNGSAIINYVDGGEMARTLASGKVSGSQNRINIGATSNTTRVQNHFKGMIDDVRIYTRALNAGEISESAKLWAISNASLFTGNYLASDPSVIFNGSSYLMAYTDFSILGGIENVASEEDAISKSRASIAIALSDDGKVWRFGKYILKGRENFWDEDIEASFLMKKNSSYYLYYSGYAHGEGNPAQGYPAHLALATSNNGVEFTRYNNGLPILRTSYGWYDSDAIYSPSIIKNGDKYFMVYAGHCYASCNNTPGVTLLYALSENGISWTKGSLPLLTSKTGTWYSDGVAEPEITYYNSTYYLFFTGLAGNLRQVGIAASKNITGPYLVREMPILKQMGEEGILAPSILIENSKLRMWLLLLKENNSSVSGRIGYLEREIFSEII